jgi:hypothetical protein
VLIFPAGFFLKSVTVGKELSFKECVEQASDDELEQLWHEIEEYRIRKIWNR